MNQLHVVNELDHEINRQPAQEVDPIREWCNRKLTSPMPVSTEEFLAFMIQVAGALRKSEIAALASQLGLNRIDVQSQVKPAAEV